MKKTYKHFIAIFLIIMLFPFAFPMTASAATGTLGSEEPLLFCTFTNEFGEVVDGNSLESGEYTVDVVLTDMATNSVFQFTADYDESVVTIDDVSSPYSESNDVSLGGIKNSDGTLVVVIVSNDESCTELSETETVFTSMTVQIDTDDAIDFADYFAFNTDPDLTFVEADYGDDIEDAYALDITPTTTYNKYQMYADESPAYYDITGKIAISTFLDGSFEDSGKGVEGITVSTVVGGETLSAVTDSNGNYTLSGVPTGTYTLSIHGSTTVDRSETLTVNRLKSTSAEELADSTKTINTIGIITCNYNGDENIDVWDKVTFNGGLREYYYYADLNGDSEVNVFDKVIFNTFLAGNVDETYTYGEVSLTIN